MERKKLFDIVMRKVERYNRDPQYTKDRFRQSMYGEIGNLKRQGNERDAKTLADFQKVFKRLERR